MLAVIKQTVAEKPDYKRIDEMSKTSQLVKKLFKYLPVLFPLLMILIKCAGLAIRPGFFQPCLVPADIAFSGFAFDVYALDMISRRQWVWPEASAWLNGPGSNTAPDRLLFVEVKLICVMLFMHCLMFLVAILVAPLIDETIYVVMASVIVAFVTCLLPVGAIEGRLQRICVS